MGKHLLLGTETAQNWRLPAETDLEALHDEIEDAMSQGTVLRVTVELQDDPRGRTTLLLNGRTLLAATAVELPEPSPQVAFGS